MNERFDNAAQLPVSALSRSCVPAAVGKNPALVEGKTSRRLPPSRSSIARDVVCRGNVESSGKTGKGTSGALQLHFQDIAKTPACFSGGLESVHEGNR